MGVLTIPAYSVDAPQKVEHAGVVVIELWMFGLGLLQSELEMSRCVCACVCVCVCVCVCDNYLCVCGGPKDFHVLCLC